MDSSTVLPGAATPVRIGEMVEQGEAVLRDRGMLGIPQESGKSGPIKARYVICIL